MRKTLWVGAVAFCLCLSQMGRGATLDFTGVPDGTLAKAGNPYFGVLTLVAQQVVGYEQPVEPPVFSDYTTDSIIKNGAIAMTPDPTQLPAGLIQHGITKAHFSATFSVPVIDVSFQASCYEDAVSTYKGIDGLGNPFSGSFAVAGTLILHQNLGDFHTVQIPIPAGGYLKDFTIDNQDAIPLHALLFVNDISFTVVPVPLPPACWAALPLVLYCIFKCRRSHCPL